MKQAPGNIDEPSGSSLPRAEATQDGEDAPPAAQAEATQDGEAAPSENAPPAAEDGIQGTLTPPLCRVWDLISGPQATHWSRLLIRDHLDCAARLALFQSCTTARDLVLVTAERASCRLEGASRKQECSLAQLQAASAAMATRGQLRTKFHMKANDPDQLPLALRVVEAGITRLDALHVVCFKPLPAPFLTDIGRSCPHLRALDVYVTNPVLPSPELFPKLKELSIAYTDDAPQSIQTVFSTTAPYIPQLTSLSVPSQFTTDSATYSLLLSPQNVGVHLRALSLRTELDDSLLSRILQCAPVLEELSVRTVALQSDALARAQHRWRKVQFICCSVRGLARLPLAPGMQLVINVNGCDDDSYIECDTISMDEASVARFRDVQFSAIGYNKIVLHLNKEADNVDTDDQPAALRVGMSLLRHLPLPQPRWKGWFALDGWTMSAEVMAELPQLPHFDTCDFTRNLVWELDLYGSLLGQLPGSFSSVQVTVDDMDDEQVESLCLGAPRDRTAQTPLSVVLWGCKAELLESVQQQMQQQGSFPHVVITRQHHDMWLLNAHHV